MNSILIVDDDPQLRESFKRLLSEEGYEVRVAATGEEGILAVKENPPHLVVMDVRMAGMTGLDAFAEIHRIEPTLPVIVMTAYGTTETAIRATQLGAFDYVLKPFDIPDILSLIGQALEAGRLMQHRLGSGEELDEDHLEAALGAAALIGKSPAMQKLYKSIGRVAPTDATVPHLR